MSKVINRIGKALGDKIASTRRIENITHIAIHHSATDAGTTSAFENTWRNSVAMGAPRAVGGYHEVILLNGDIELNYLPTQISYGVGGQNAYIYNICLVGNFTKSTLRGKQMTTLLERIRFNVNRFPKVSFDRVLGHNEFPNQATACPAINMNNLRKEIKKTPTTGGTVNSSNTHIVKSGDTLTAIARKNNTTVAELIRLNNMTTTTADKLSIGQVIKLPNKNPQSNGSLKAGDTLVSGRIISGARWLDSNIIIPDFVRNRNNNVYEVNGNRIVLSHGGTIVGALSISNIK